MIDNPDYKGEWKPKQIPNPAYKGRWIHPEISNPDFFEDNQVYAFDNLGAVGIEIWQVKAGTIFDNIIVTDSVSEAEAFMASTFEKHKAAEKTMFDSAEKSKRDAEEESRKKAEEERKKTEASNAEEDDDDEDDDEDDKKPKEHEDL
jgi:calreticulin